MNWYETTFVNLIARHNPIQRGIKLSLNPKKDDIGYWYYPLGVLHKIAFQENIKTNEFVA